MSNLQNAQKIILWRGLQKQSKRVRTQNIVIVFLTFLLSFTLLSILFTINNIDKHTDWFYCEGSSMSSDSHSIQLDNDKRFSAINTEKTFDEEEIQSILVDALLLQIGEEKAQCLKYNIIMTCLIEDGDESFLFVKYEFKPKGFFESLFSKKHTDSIFIVLKE